MANITLRKSTIVRFLILSGCLVTAGCSTPKYGSRSHCPPRHVLSCIDTGAGPKRCACTSELAIRQRFENLPSGLGAPFT